MPDPKVIDPKHKAKVKAYFKEREKRGSIFGHQSVDHQQTNIDKESPWSSVWLKDVTTGQVYGTVDKDGTYHPPTTGSQPISKKRPKPFRA